MDQENIKKEEIVDENQPITDDKNSQEGKKQSSKKNKKEKKNESSVEDSQNALNAKIAELTAKIEELNDVVAQKNDQYLRLQAEFDNYRKRSLKEKMELTKSATSGLLLNVLPVVDDFDRAMQVLETAADTKAIKEGIDLIYKRFVDFLTQNGVKEIEAKGLDFDVDMHDAITKIPAPSEELKGKVVDVIQKGYLLNDKVIRFAKVVIGE